MRILLAFSLLAFSLAAAAASTLYRWTDESGNVHYSDTAPPADAKTVQKMGMAGQGAGEAPSALDQSYAMQQAVKKFPVTVYTSKQCGNACKDGLGYLKKRGIPYTEKVVATQHDIDALVKLVGAAQVPVLVVGIDVRKGYSEQGWSEALDTAGYPHTGAAP
ncbi:MAG TPA: glutaredoxin family protein [Burkholderiales bacterium]|nr:glutaredoxin family protein [Burkholderiales bacterium]